jgi:hypothetical protein
LRSFLKFQTLADNTYHPESMTKKQKIEALSLIQDMLGRSMHILPIHLELTDEEVESMGDEYLIETGLRPSEPKGERFAVVSILPDGLKLLRSKNLHVPRSYVEVPPATLTGKIGSVLANRLWEIAMAVFVIVATALLAAYLK